MESYLSPHLESESCSKKAITLMEWERVGKDGKRGEERPGTYLHPSDHAQSLPIHRFATPDGLFQQSGEYHFFLCRPVLCCFPRLWVRMPLRARVIRVK